jgi:hypothetical protein
MLRLSYLWIFVRQEEILSSDSLPGFAVLAWVFFFASKANLPSFLVLLSRLQTGLGPIALSQTQSFNRGIS